MSSQREPNSLGPLEDKVRKLHARFVEHKSGAPHSDLETAPHPALPEPFSAAMDHFPGVVVLYDAERRIQYANRQTITIGGHSADHFIGRRDEDLFPPDVTSAYLPFLRRAFETRSPQTAEFTLAVSAGVDATRVTYVPLLDGQDNLQMLAFIQDASREPSAQQALRELQDRLNKSFHDSPTPRIMSRVEDHVIVDVSASLLALFGYARDELVGRNEFETGIWVHPEEHNRLMREIRAGGSVRDIRVKGRRKSGGVRQLLLSADKIKIGGVECLNIHLVDVTERELDEQRIRRHTDETQRHAEEMSRYAALMKQYADERQQRAAQLERRVQERTAELEAERARWQGIVEGIADEVWVCDAQGKMSLINLPNATHMGLAEFENKTVEQVYEEADILNPDGQMRPLEQAPLLRSLRGELVRGEEIMRHRRTGVTRYREYSSAPMRDASGAITGAVAIVRDITEQKQIQNQIRQLNQALEQKATELQVTNKELESFSYSVSHDLRTPLGAIIQMTRAVLEEYGAQLPERARSMVQLVQANGETMDNLVTSLLTLSRSASQPLNKEHVQLTKLVPQVWTDLLAQTEGRRVEFALGALPACYADPILLRQVWTNLLANALKFTRMREVAHITVGSYEKDGQTVYFVKDNGIGFDMETAGQLFGVFRRFHSEEEYEGNGVGLAIVERIVRRHGGYLCADAHVDQGATFFFTLRGS